MKNLLVASMLATLSLSACVSHRDSNSETKEITGTNVQPYWSDASGIIAPQDRNTFEDLNPGYELRAEQYITRKVNTENEIEYTRGALRLSIYKFNYEGILMRRTPESVAHSDATLKKIKRCDAAPAEDKSYAAEGGQGIFVEGKLIGTTYQSPDLTSSGSHLCVDKLIGLKFCDENNQMVQMAGCTIPVIKGGAVGNKVVVLK